MQVKIIDFKSGAKAPVFLRGGFTWCLYMMQGKA
jgi:hypothetical protein